MAFLTWFLLTAGILTGVGYAVTLVAVSPPRDVFRAGFFEFDLAPGWWCERDGTEYICTPRGKSPHSAIVVIAMKERNAADNLVAYEAHLRDPKQSGTSGTMSEIRFVKRRILGGNEWVEALHRGSEIPDYDTYYLGTTTAMLGILVTMSVHKDQSSKYISELTGMIDTLAIYQR